MDLNSLFLVAASSQYASITDASQTGLDITGDMSGEAWVKIKQLPSTAGDDFNIFSKYLSTGNQRSYRFFINDSSDRLEFFASPDGTFTNFDNEYFNNVVTSDDIGKWVHLAFSYDVSARSIKLYKNGKLLSSTNANTGTVTAIQNGTGAFALGTYFNASATGFMDGHMKHVRIFDDIRTQSEIVADAHTEGVTDANLQGEWLLDGDYTDTSGNSNTLTATASPVFSVDVPWEAPVGVESSDYVLNLIAASTQYATIANASITGLNITGDLTLEAWVNVDDLSSVRTILSKANNTETAADNHQYTLRIETDGDLTLFWEYGSGSNEQATTTAGGYVKEGELVHIAVARDVSANNVLFYVNGVLVETISYTNDPTDGGSSDFFIGVGQGDSQYFDGTLREVRVFDDIRTQSEILADAMTANVTDANLQGEWVLNNSYADTSGNSNTLTASGSPSFQKWKNAIIGLLTSWWTFDETSGTRADSHGSNDLTDNNTVGYATGKKSNGADFEADNSEYLSITDGSQNGLEPGSDDFSVSLWFKPESQPATNTQKDLVSKYNAAGNQRGWWLTYRDISGTKYLNFRASDNGSDADDHNIAYTLSNDTWYHIVMKWDASAHAVEFFVNGISIGIDASGTRTSILNTTADFWIGGQQSAGGVNFQDGILDEVAYFASKLLDYGEVLDLYNAGNAITYQSVQEYLQSLIATPNTTASVSTAKTILQVLVGNATVTASVATVADFVRTLTANVTATASVVKQMSQSLTANTSATASMLAQRVFLVAMEATTSVTSTLSTAKTIAQTLAANVTTTASVAKSTMLNLTISVTTSVTTALIVTRNVTMVASTAVTSTMSRVAGKMLTASVSVIAKLRAPFWSVKYPEHGDGADYTVKYDDHV